MELKTLELKEDLFSDKLVTFHLVTVYTKERQSLNSTETLSVG